MVQNRKPKRYYNIRIDEETYKSIRALKRKKAIVEFLREVFVYDLKVVRK